MIHTRSKAARFILDNSLLLLFGTAAAVVWANVDLASYEHLAHPLHFAVNDVGMVFFLLLQPRKSSRRRCQADRWPPRVVRSPR